MRSFKGGITLPTIQRLILIHTMFILPVRFILARWVH
jgi:hypothetical protein